VRLIIAHCLCHHNVFLTLPTTILQELFNPLHLFKEACCLLHDHVAFAIDFASRSRTTPIINVHYQTPFLPKLTIPLRILGALSYFISVIYKFTYVSLIFFPSSSFDLLLIYRFLSIFSHSNSVQKNIDFYFAIVIAFKSLHKDSCKFRDRSLSSIAFSRTYHRRYAVIRSFLRYCLCREIAFTPSLSLLATCTYLCRGPFKNAQVYFILTLQEISLTGKILELRNPPTPSVHLGSSPTSPLYFPSILDD